jgi:hypothetical protein
MIGHECRCPGCGSCGAAQEVERLRDEVVRLRFAAKALYDKPYVDSLRSLVETKNGERIVAEHLAMVAERERDELKARLAHAEADAEQAIHNEAFMERQRIVAYIHARLAHATMDDRVSMRERGVMIDLGNAIERGEHER